MNDIFSSSYTDPGIQHLITAFVSSLKIKRAIEIGTQQGMSAILIAAGLEKEGRLYTYDLFTTTYSKPPYSETHANWGVASQNIREHGLSDRVSIHKGDYMAAFEEQVDICGTGYSPIDLLHVDICNHYDNLSPILERLAPLTTKGIILEGGINNEWQKKHSYKPYNPYIFQRHFMEGWDHLTIPINEHNAVTLCTKRVK